MAEEILKILNDVNLPKKDVISITEYLDNNEYGIAFELLCSAIVQEGKKVITEQKTIIKAIGEYMGYSSDLWESIQVKKES